MSQREFLQAMDADLHAAFAGAGMADSGVYISAGTTDEIPCRCFLDDVNIQEMGDAGLVLHPRKELSILREDVAQPRRGDQVTLDGKSYILQTKQESDESLTRWTVNHD